MQVVEIKAEYSGLGQGIFDTEITDELSSRAERRVFCSGIDVKASG